MPHDRIDWPKLLEEMEKLLPPSWGSPEMLRGSQIETNTEAIKTQKKSQKELLEQKIRIAARRVIKI